MTTEKRPQPERDPSAAPAKSGRTKKKSRWMLVGPLLVAVCGASLLAGGVAGYRIAGRRATPASHPAHADSGAKWWTCSMHPQIRLPKPGKCPICFMDLVPLEAESAGGPRQLKMSKEAMALAGIRTERVGRRYVANQVRMVGKVDYDETRLVDVTSWIPRGRLDRLYVDYTGTSVRKGDHLYSVYSPDLVVAQRELLLSSRPDDRWSTGLEKQSHLNTPEMTEAKLRRWGLLPEQIDKIRQRGTPTDHLTIYAPVGGIVVRKYVNEGVWVQEGTKVYTIADLARVWVHLDAYESDVPWLRYGQEVEFSTQAYPGEIFKGRIAFIDPVLNEKTRTVKVRVNVPNEDLRLKPGMFAHAIVRSQLAAGGRVLDASLAGKWISPMHPEIVRDGPGKCDICGMDLVPAEELGFVAPEKAAKPPLVVPATAPLLTGKRAIVYVRRPDREEPTFEGREVLLGHRAGDYYIVRHGLKEGEEVVTVGNFKIDSALQLRPGKLSMMSPPDALAQSGGSGAELDVPEAFRAALNPLYESYLAAAEALADDDLDQARKSVRAILAAADAVDAQSVGSLVGLRVAEVHEVLSRWEEITHEIVLAASETADAKDRATARRHFAELSKCMLRLFRVFGHALPEPVYEVHCPMAFDGKGADWLQYGRAVRNPYFGPAGDMLHCGRRTATFHSRAPLENVSAEFRRQLSGLYRPYLKLQESLADDRLPDAVSAWRAMPAALASVSADGLDGRARRAWQAIREELQDRLKADWREAEIEGARQRFEAVSITMLSMAGLFGHAEDGPLYKAFCPMAFDNKGAFWLQSGKEIANPYFGHKMLRCGEIRRTFPSAGGAPIKKNPGERDPVGNNPVEKNPSDKIPAEGGQR